MSATPARQSRVLIVEDDEKAANALKRGLESEGHAVEMATTGEDGFYRATAESFDLVILDVLLPGRDGLEVLTTLRRLTIDVPVLMLTARDTMDDRVRGLDLGADDYLVKPYSFAELVARVRALLRRSRPREVTSLAVADLVVDLVLRRVVRGGSNVDLTAREFDLLVYLLHHQKQIVSREMLMRDVWKEDMRATSLDNVIDVHMTRLRRKIDRDPEHKLIHTIRGVGFVVGADDP